MVKGHVFVKYGPGDVVHIIGPNMEVIDLYPGSEVHLTFNIYKYEKKEKK